MAAGSNCPWAHIVGGTRCEAVLMFRPHVHWRVLNRAMGVLLPFDLSWASSQSRGELLLGLDRTAATMGNEAFARRLNGEDGMLVDVCLSKREGAELRFVGVVRVRVSGEFMESDAVAAAFHDLVPVEDAGDRLTNFVATLSLVPEGGVMAAEPETA